nr:MAG TPA: hypothetical protein [Caudoviricetes sp.]
MTPHLKILMLSNSRWGGIVTNLPKNLLGKQCHHITADEINKHTVDCIYNRRNLHKIT